MKVPIVILMCLLGTAPASAFAQDLFSPYSELHGLRAPLEKLALSDVTFEDGLRTLAAAARPNAVIGFEPAIADSGAEATKIVVPRITLAVKKSAVGEVLALMCAADSRYTYSEAQPGVIDVRPKLENREVAAIMDIPVPSAKIVDRDWLMNVVMHIAGYVPELGRYLQAKELAWSRHTGRPPRGAAGSVMGSTVPIPEISIEIQNTNVRGVLDAIAAYSLVHGSRTPIEDPWVPPTGWRVDFKQDPEAFTGLGGYVSWSRFP